MATVTYLSFLSDPVGSGLGLEIILGVPVRVKDNYCVSWRQIDTQTTSTRRQQEAKILSTQMEIHYTCYST